MMANTTSVAVWSLDPMKVSGSQISNTRKPAGKKKKHGACQFVICFEWIRTKLMENMKMKIKKIE